MLASPMPASAQAPEVTACGIVTLEDAERIVGGPLQAIERVRVKTPNGPDTYDSICTYIPRDAKIDTGPAVARLLDLTLHVLNSPREAEDLLVGSLVRYRQLTGSRNFPFPDATVVLIDGFGKGAFVMEAVTDRRAGYRSALIAFAKGRIGGTVGAWSKPNSSLETAKAALRHILDRLP